MATSEEIRELENFATKEGIAPGAQKKEPKVAAPEPATSLPTPDDSLQSDFISARAKGPDPVKAMESFAQEGAAVPESATAAVPERVAPDQSQPLSSAMSTWWATGPGPVTRGVGAVAKDVGSGAMGIVPEVVGGALDYVNNLFKFADDAVKAAEKAGLPNIYFQLLNKEGGWDPQMLSTEQFRQEQAEGKNQVFQVPTTGEPDSVTGSIVRTGTTFLLGRGKIAGKGAGVRANVLADLVSGVTSMDPSAPRLSNLIDSVAPNFVTDFLKAKPEDEGTLIGRLKAGLEMAGLGGMLTGAIKAVKALKAADTGAAAPGAIEGAEPSVETAPEVEVTAKRTYEGYTKEGEPTVKTTTELQPETAEPAMQGIQDLENDLPWKQEPAVNLGPHQTYEAASATAKGGGGVMEVPDRGAIQFLALGKPDEPVISFKPEVGAHAEAGETYLAQEAGSAPAPLRMSDYISGGGENPIRVNLARIGGPDDIRDAIARVAKFIPRAEVVSHEETVWAADGSGLTPEQLLTKTGIGQPGGLPEQIASARANLLAARFIRDSGAEQLIGYAKAAVADGAGPEQKAMALKALATQMAIQQEVSGASTEAGRLLESLKIESTTRAQAGQAIQNIIEQAGGRQSVDTLLGRLATMDSPEEMARAVTAAGKMSARDWMLYGSYNAYLSPRTILKKVVSDGLMGMWNLATRYAAATYSDDITIGQVNQLAYGYATSFKDGIRAAVKAMKAGSSQFQREYQSMDALHYGRLAQLAETTTPETVDGAAKSYIRMAMPTTWIGATDDFAKTINYRAALRYNAYGQAIEQGATAEEAKASADTIMALTMENVPDSLHAKSVQDALQNTFQEPLQGLGLKIKDFADGINIPVGHGSKFEIPVGRMLVPFVKIPANIMAWAYRNSPLPLLSMSNAVKSDMLAGGVSRDLAMARIGLGTGLTASTIALALTGKLTGGGPSTPELNKAWRAAGNEPYTLDLGLGKFHYNNLEPMGTTLSVIADTLEIMKFSKEEDSAALAESLVFGTGKAMLNKSYLMGVGEFFRALENPDSEAGKWAARFAAGLAAPQTVSAVAKGLDEWRRAHYGFLETVESRIPGLSQNLPPARTRWGDPIPWNEAFLPGLSGTGIARTLSPVDLGIKTDAEPIDKWIWENRLAFPRGPENKLGLQSVGGPVQTFSPPGARGVVAQVELTPEQLDRYKVLAGNGLKDPVTQLGAKDTLNALVNGVYPQPGLQQQWDKASAAGKALVVQTAVNKFRAAAKMQLIEEFPDLKDALTAGWQQKIQQLQQPVMQ